MWWSSGADRWRIPRLFSAVITQGVHRYRLRVFHLVADAHQLARSDLNGTDVHVEDLRPAGTDRYLQLLGHGFPVRAGSRQDVRSICSRRHFHAARQSRREFLAGRLQPNRSGILHAIADQRLLTARHALERDPTAHAEVLVLRRASAELAVGASPGTTLYVTLEPC